MKKIVLFIVFSTFFNLTAQCPPGSDPNDCNPGASCADACRNEFNNQVQKADNEYSNDIEEAASFLSDPGYWEDMAGAYQKGNVWEAAKASKAMKEALDKIDKAGREYANHLDGANSFLDACLGNC